MSAMLIKNGLLVDDRQSRTADVLIRDGKIAEIGENLKPERGADIVDAAGLAVMPGFIDAHTHYSLVSRGTVTADDFESGSRCAAFGGCTTVVDFADHNKKKTLLESAEDRKSEMKGRMAVDYALHQGVYGIPTDLEHQLDELKKSGINVIKIFTTYRNVGYLIENKDELRRLFRAAAERKMLITAHCEDNEIIEKTDAAWKGDFKPASHSLLRTSEAEAQAIKTFASIAGEENCPFYVVHLSSKAGLEAVRELRAKGLKIYAETTPTYLFKEKSLLERKDGAMFIMTPPLRDAKDNSALKDALVKGEIQVIATDHCAFTAKQKIDTGADCRTTYPGVPGTAEMFSSVHTYLSSNGKLSLNALVSLMSTNPAKIFGLYPHKGTIAVGSDADIVLFDVKKKWKPDENIVSKSGYTLFFDDTFTGQVKKTILHGKVIMDDGKYFGKAGDGRFLKEMLP